MVYSGRLPLSISPYYGFEIESLSQSDPARQIQLVEQDAYGCAAFNPNGRCYSHVATYESDFLARTAVYALPPITFGLVAYYQRGIFVFHSGDGQHRYLVSRLYGAPGGTQSYYLTVMQ